MHTSQKHSCATGKWSRHLTPAQRQLLRESPFADSFFAFVDRKYPSVLRPSLRAIAVEFRPPLEKAASARKLGRLFHSVLSLQYCRFITQCILESADVCRRAGTSRKKTSWLLGYL
jgi:hypothetical protein